MNFANTLKKLREVNGITQEQLAEYLKVTRPTIAGYETKNRQPDFEKLIKIAEFFHVSVDYMLTGKEYSRNSHLTKNTLDDEVYLSCRNLSFSAKQDVLKYIKLLELDKKYGTNKQ